MSIARKLNETPEQAIKRMHLQHGDGDVTIHSQQNVTDVLRNNKMNFNERGGRWNEFQNHVARIPTSIYWSLVKQGIIDEKKDPDGVAFTAWLNDPDNSAWRTRPGRI